MKKAILVLLCFAMLFSTVSCVTKKENSNLNTHTPETSSDTTDTVTPCTHILGAWSISKEATEYEDGEEKRTCSLCEYFETKEIARDAHNDADGNGACDSCNRTIEEVDNNANDELDVQVSGCGSVIGGSLWFVAVILVSTVAIAADKKRKY